jgi:hypothetical protein
MLQEFVIAPRDKERAQPGQRHLYDKEDFGLRHKTFWELDMTQSLLTKFIQKLTHESDGLIFQPVSPKQLPQHSLVPNTWHASVMPGQVRCEPTMAASQCAG